MKLKDLSFIFLLSVVGVLFSILSLLWKFFIENGTLLIIAVFYVTLWMIKFAIHFF